MAKARKAQQPVTRLSIQVSRALREGALYVFGALAFILWFALFTYDPSDPGFSQATSNVEVQNGIGRVGALVADFLFNFFGRPAYLFTIMVFYLGWMLYREQKTQIELTRMDFALRLGGFLATLVASCALSTLHFSPVGFNETAGGIIGQIVGHRLEAVMKLLGASTLLFVILGSGRIHGRGVAGGARAQYQYSAMSWVAHVYSSPCSLGGDTPTGNPVDAAIEGEFQAC